MNKIRLVAISICTLCCILATGCSKEEKYDVDYSNEIAEMTFSADAESYKSAFSTYLNKGVYEGSLEDIDSSLISSNLISSIDVEVDDSVQEPPPTISIDEDDTTEDYEYPIIDMFGNIIDYGSKEESDKSFEEYANQPYYTVMSCDIYYNTVLFKVFDKGQSQIKVYEAKLNESKQIDSFQILDIKG